MRNSNISNAAAKIEVYDLPEEAIEGGSWDLPKWFIDHVDAPKAPYWDFPFPEFTAFISSVKKTDDPNILLVEYCVYRRDAAHCAGWYGLWTTGKAMVDINTHRRWDVE